MIAGRGERRLRSEGHGDDLGVEPGAVKGGQDVNCLVDVRKLYRENGPRWGGSQVLTNVHGFGCLGDEQMEERG